MPETTQSAAGTSGPTWWSWDLAAPNTMVPGRVPVVEHDAVGPEQVLLEFVVGGICGSDVPKYSGAVHVAPDHPRSGFPLHELVGVVRASGSERLPVGQRVLAMSTTHHGLREQVLLPAAHVVPLPDDLPDDVAVVSQPTGTVCSALRDVGDVTGRSALVIGLGSTGLLAAHLLASRGARVTGVDPLDRSDVAADFGVHELVTARSRHLVGTGSTFDLVVEAVGHNTETFVDACRLVGMDGQVVAFGVPDHDDYPFPMDTFFRRNAVLRTGVTQDWTRFLAMGVEHVRTHQDVMRRAITHVMGLDEVPEAYRLAAAQREDRVKVTIRA
ncbi:zinc-binding dehydrogenase [Auraticoccus sp. F435]|uniref:Zinc-binding dehydrogenase n=1 Tax=Auraticoccus cholistanensis TaxID=2656650 RepID=A0A6A9USH4_9ACTN|nr:zinc-binding dehydrogenase [Auraticoccus cholistanensis]MVA75763.1 zinc-binding dehydrogenase [Auraticoccus cholistanensis]